MRRIPIAASALWLLAASPVVAQPDTEGCTDHPLFNRLPHTHIIDCERSQFDLRRYPTGAPIGDDNATTPVDVEGAVYWVSYELDDGQTPASGLQIRRNFEAALKKAGGTIEGTYPGWCKAQYDPEGMPRMGNGCTSDGLTGRITTGGKETWLFLQAGDDGSYQLTFTERQAMKQEIAANQLADQLQRDGFVTLSVNFDSGTATIRPDSARVLDDAAAALQLAAGLRVEVAGHTDSSGTPEGNLKLSQERAEAVRGALVARGVPAARLTAKGYGQTVPIADNRTEEGRAKNRRVELVRQ